MAAPPPFSRCSRPGKTPPTHLWDSSTLNTSLAFGYQWTPHWQPHCTPGMPQPLPGILWIPPPLPPRHQLGTLQ
ncbi:hypothetical protein PtB15_5B613 [Puccinia triticina]|nr:hypothetical protein PtB15_5B613 [Puccinia triticina]